MASYVQAVLTPDPLYLQPKTYDARSDRKGFQDIMSPGVVGAGDFLVSLTSGLGISIAAGAAYILGQNIADQGTYRQYVAAAVPLSVTAANATNPRLDQVIIRVLDTAADSSGSSEARIEIVPGTPTAGATLANRNGAANLTTLLEASKSVLLLADILVPAGAINLTGGNLADRRKRTRPISASTIGTLAARPLATDVPSGNLYWATDDAGGTLYVSNGTTWTKIIANQWASARAHGTLSWTAADNQFRIYSAIAKVGEWQNGLTFFDPTLLRIIIPATGYYQVEVRYQAFSAGGACTLQPVLNGTDTDFMSPPNSAAGAVGPDAAGTGPRSIFSSIIRAFTQNDTIYPGGSHTGGGTCTAYMAIIKLPL